MVLVRRDRIMNMVRHAKSKPCRDCGVEYPHYVMDLHHRDPEQKRFKLSRAHSHGLAAVLEELAKCDVLCANCHRKREYHER